MISVKLSDPVIQLAEEWSQKVLSRLPPRPDYTGIQDPDRFLTGYLGEFAFFQLLLNRNKKALYYVNIAGKSEKEDFELFMINGKDLKADVKTTGKPYINNFLINKQQYELNPYDIYIGTKIHGRSEVGIYGWCTLGELGFKEDGFTKEKKPTYFKPLNQLRSIEALLVGMIDGRPEFKKA